ncbi:hypothetical protein V3C99_004779 [Haemonchus contortus]
MSMDRVTRAYSKTAREEFPCYG